MHKNAVSPSEFDENLAKRIAKKLGVKEKSFPCIVFDLKTDIAVFKLPKDNSDLRILFTSLTESISDFWFENNSSEKSRSKFIKYLKRDVTKKYLVKRIKDPKSLFKLIPIMKDAVNVFD